MGYLKTQLIVLPTLEHFVQTLE